MCIFCSYRLAKALPMWKSRMLLSSHAVEGTADVGRGRGILDLNSRHGQP